MVLPLQGIRILDLTRLLPGAVCTLLLADMGADVIKIEDPQGGDYARWTPPLIDGLGAFFRASNRNKRSIILNLKEPAGQAVFHRLAQGADVVIEGFRPGVTRRLNVDYETLSVMNPRIVYCSLSGWGADGPYADRSGHDLNYVALGGLQGSARAQLPLGGQVADVGGAYAGVMGVLAALVRRATTGTGDFVDVSLFESALPFAMYQWVETAVTGVPGGQGSLTGGMAFYDVYYSADDQPMAFAPIEPKFWRNFCEAVERPDWIARHLGDQAALKVDVQALFATRTLEAWQALLGEVDCCWTPISSPEHLVEDPQVRARGMAGLDSSGLPWMRSPVRLSAPMPDMTPAPAYGQHTHEVLSEAGYTLEEVTDLVAQGIAATG